MANTSYDIVVIGGGHAGAEAAWAASNMGARTALVTMDPARIGQMSCNPAIGGLAKGQIVREIDALGGLMGLAIDATGIQFRMLNMSKGAAVRGPRAQADKYAYAEEVQRLLKTRENLTIVSGSVEDFIMEDGRCVGVIVTPTDEGGEATADCCGGFGAPENDRPKSKPAVEIRAGAVVLTTGTFMRGLMHTGEKQTPGGRVGEGSAEGVSGALRRCGFELGRLKTGTPPRLDARTIDLGALELQPGDERPAPFSDLTALPGADRDERYPTFNRFPVLKQTPCWITHTNEAMHELIRANLDRAPMYNGQIDTAGPRYCPSIEDKVVRFADKLSHHVFLEPESHRTNEVYCNGISTSLPTDVQDQLVAMMPGCENAKILRYGYAVEYDMVIPKQIDATTMSKPLPGLLLAGQINGTTGYEEAAGQGLLAGVNAVRWWRGEELVRLGRDQAYIGVLLDDLVTKAPTEPYRMFTSRAEHRLVLRSDNAPDRLTPLGRELGLIDDARWEAFGRRREAIEAMQTHLQKTWEDGVRLSDWLKRPEVDEAALAAKLEGVWLPNEARDARLLTAVLSEAKYEPFVTRLRQQHQKLTRREAAPLPSDADYGAIKGLRNEARHVLETFRPATFGQASRLAGITPADLTVLTFAFERG
ncbi:MAG: tRNA uridine-5-carboxymethylaminomethyl(34) synthesis enzyme MnmG [Planctomycetota bacterium]|jgi:tRNA uridine 5-carboxymethylaminomethyl modification enzyme